MMQAFDLGIAHGEERREFADRASERLAEDGVEVVLVGFSDNAGVTRARAVPLARFSDAACDGVGLSSAWHVVTATDRVTTSKYVGNPAGDIRLVADPRAAAPVPGLDGFAWAPADLAEKDGTVHACCARSLLRGAVQRLERLGLRAHVGYELEWWCTPHRGVGSGQDLEPSHDGPAVGVLPLLHLAPMVRELLRDCSGAPVAVEAVNAEYSNGQLECSLSPKEPVAAVDANVLARLAIHAAAERHGYRASFAPAFSGPMGNGGHLHLSLWREGENCFASGGGPAGMGSEAAAFVAGMLEHLDAITAIGAPTVASYLRLRPSRWAGAWRCWGVENREAALRLVAVAPGRERLANVEVKCFDEAANPYLLLAALLHAGADGIERTLTLPPAYAGDPAGATEHERAQAGVARLPASLGAAIESMTSSAFLADLLGPALFDSYLAVRREELAAFEGASDDEIVAAYLFRY